MPCELPRLILCAGLVALLGLLWLDTRPRMLAKQ
jgi:hypothetical protein